MEPTRELTDEDMVYHYTTSEGIRGIVENGELWATGARYLNDLAELQLVFEAAVWVLKTHYLQQRPEMRESIELAIDMFSKETGSLPYYVTSFSTFPNALSQWRGYGGVDQAYVIGLVREDLVRHAAAIGWKMVKVQYGVQSARIAAAQVVARGFERIDAGEFCRWDDLNKVQGALRLGLNAIAAEHKDDSFEEEREWRLISPRLQGLSGDEIFFRSNRKGLVPYVKFPLRKELFPARGRPEGSGESVEMLVLGEVAAGPGATRDTGSALSELLFANRVHIQRNISRKRIPYSGR